MNKKFILALAIVLCTIALVAGGTFALYTAQSGTANNSFTTANLSITANRDDGEYVPGPMFYVTAAQGATYDGEHSEGDHPTGVWAPGDPPVRRTLIVQNTSGMDAWLDAVSASLKIGSHASLANKLYVTIYYEDSTNNQDLKVAEGWLSNFTSGNVQLRFEDGSRIRSRAGSFVFLHFDVSFDASAGNDLQDKTLVADFTVHAVQARNN